MAPYGRQGRHLEEVTSQQEVWSPHSRKRAGEGAEEAPPSPFREGENRPREAR